MSLLYESNREICYASNTLVAEVRRLALGHPQPGEVVPDFAE